MFARTAAWLADCVACCVLPVRPCCLLLPWCCQGGMFIFDGETCVWSHFDQATGAHADYADVIKVADSISSSKDCRCSTP